MKYMFRAVLGALIVAMGIGVSSLSAQHKMHHKDKQHKAQKAEIQEMMQGWDLKPEARQQLEQLEEMMVRHHKLRQQMHQHRQQMQKAQRKLGKHLSKQQLRELHQKLGNGFHHGPAFQEEGRRHGGMMGAHARPPHRPMMRGEKHRPHRPMTDERGGQHHQEMMEEAAPKQRRGGHQMGRHPGVSHRHMHAHTHPSNMYAAPRYKKQQARQFDGRCPRQDLEGRFHEDKEGGEKN